MCASPSAESGRLRDQDLACVRVQDRRPTEQHILHLADLFEAPPRLRPEPSNDDGAGAGASDDGDDPAGVVSSELEHGFLLGSVLGGSDGDGRELVSAGQRAFSPV
jgi:hypothetical protein